MLCCVSNSCFVYFFCHYSYCVLIYIILWVYLVSLSQTFNLTACFRYINLRCSIFVFFSFSYNCHLARVFVNQSNVNHCLQQRMNVAKKKIHFLLLCDNSMMFPSHFVFCDVLMCALQSSQKISEYEDNNCRL